MKLSLSKPLLIGLLLTMIISIILLLKPEPLPNIESIDLLPQIRLLQRQPTGIPAHSSDISIHRVKAMGSVNIKQVIGGFIPIPPSDASISKITTIVSKSIPVPEPKIQLPALTYMGRLEDEQGIHVFLSSNDLYQSVKAGDIIDQLWKVKEIKANGMALDYLLKRETHWLPLNQ